MKRQVCAVFGLLALTISSGICQDFVAPEGVRDVPVTPVQPSEGMSVEGVVAAIFKNPQPLQLINPLAPASEGNGEAFVSRDPNDPGKPKGIIVFGIEW